MATFDSSFDIVVLTLTKNQNNVNTREKKYFRFNTGPVFAYKLRYIVGFEMVKNLRYILT